jgi:hypothetical protein
LGVERERSILQLGGVALGGVAIAVFGLAALAPANVGQRIYFFWIGLLSGVYFALVIAAFNA